MDGGRLLGQGRYGCAFDPPLVCKDKKSSSTTRTIGKITHKEDAITEIKVSQDLSQIPYAQEYFILINSVCKPESRDKQVDSELKDCDSEFVKKKRLTDLLQIEMPFGGESLSCVIPNMCLNKLSRKNIIPHHFSIVQHLLEAGTLLLVGGFVHYDMHMGNILYDSNHVVRLIDFGLSWKVDQLNENTLRELYRQYNPKIGQGTPECDIFNGIISNPDRAAEYFVDDIVAKKHGLAYVEYVLRVSKNTQKEELNYFIKYSKTFKNRDWVKFFKIYWTKMDAWAVGMASIKLYNDLLHEKDFVETEGYKMKHLSLEKVLRGLLCLDPYNRMNCAMALTEFAPDSKILKLDAVKNLLATKYDAYM